MSDSRHTTKKGKSATKKTTLSLSRLSDDDVNDDEEEEEEDKEEDKEEDVFVVGLRKRSATKKKVSLL